MWRAVFAFVVELLGWLKTLALPIAYALGRLAGIKEAAGDENALNAELQETYHQIEMREVDDKTIDDRLDAGTI